MTERGIDISGEFPKPWTDETVRAADVVITMGCGDACPIFPGKRYEDWPVDDPAGQDLDTVRRIRDDVERRVRVLLDSLRARAASGAGQWAGPASVRVGRHRAVPGGGRPARRVAHRHRPHESHSSTAGPIRQRCPQPAHHSHHHRRLPLVSSLPA